MELNTFFALLTAIWLGWLIWLERDISHKNDSEQFWWFRTFSLISLSGAISVILDTYLKLNWIFTFWLLIIISIFILVSYIYSSFKMKEIWITSEITALLTYILGIFVWLWQNKFAIIFSILLVVIISLKESFEKIINSISKEEFMHSLKFAVIAFVILPLLPDDKYSIIQMLSVIGFGFIFFFS